MIQRIQLTQGCPNGCIYCYEPGREYKTYPMPELIGDYIEVLDMNFLSNPQAIDHLKRFAEIPIDKELVCGLDYRLLTPEIARLLKAARFIKPRFAWDFQFGLQKIMKKTVKMLASVGYQRQEISVFILVNWKIPYTDCVRKLDLLKVWNVKVNDCCWDGGYKLAKPVYWTPEQILKYRRMCRKHNQMVLFGIDPEYKSQDKVKQELLVIT